MITPRTSSSAMLRCATASSAQSGSSVPTQNGSASAKTSWPKVTRRKTSTRSTVPSVYPTYPAGTRQRSQSALLPNCCAATPSPHYTSASGHTMHIYRARVFDTPTTPFTGGSLRADPDIALVVDDGQIIARTDIDSAQSAYPDAELVDLREGILIPGLIDTHVHYPQVRA